MGNTKQYEITLKSSTSGNDRRVGHSHQHFSQGKAENPDKRKPEGKLQAAEEHYRAQIQERGKNSLGSLQGPVSIPEETGKS